MNRGSLMIGAIRLEAIDRQIIAGARVKKAIADRIIIGEMMIGRVSPNSKESQMIAGSSDWQINLAELQEIAGRLRSIAGRKNTRMIAAKTETRSSTKLLRGSLGRGSP